MKKELKREVCGEMASLALNKSHGEDGHLLHNATSSSSSDINRSHAVASSMCSYEAPGLTARGC